MSSSIEGGLRKEGKMLTIHKFPFDISDYVSIQIPRDARILHVELQRGVPTMWALVDTNKQSEAVHFRVFGTGYEIDPHIVEDQDSYIKSFQQGPFVWHLFRVSATDPVAS
jgi:hypothetical protein